MDTEKLLTITIPAYNAEKYIRQCVDSMILPDHQMKQMEILIVDDGGTDHTADIAKEYESHYPGTIKFCHKGNGGHGSVINYGIEHASGLYFKVVDGDDWLKTKELRGFLSALEKFTIDAADGKKPLPDLIASDYQCIEDETHKVLREMPATNDTSKYGQTGKLSEGFPDKVIKMHSLTVRTSILRKMKYRMDEHCFYVDAEYITYPILYAETVYYDHRNLYQYRLGRKGQSMDIKSMQKNHAQHRRVLNSLEEFYTDLPQMAEQKKHYIERCIAQIVENEFQIAISEGMKPGVQNSLRTWDQDLQKKYPGIYHSTEKKSITLLRKTNYRILPLGRIALKLAKGI